MDQRSFSKLPKGKTRSSNQFKIEGGQPTKLVDAKRIAPYTLESHLEQEAQLENLAYDLVKTCNYRVGCYDPLLNSIEAWTKIYEFVIESFPALLSSGVLQPIVDLDACLHDLVVNKQPGLVYHRDRWMDGGYRTLEEISELAHEGKKPRQRSNRAVRAYRDRQEGMTVLVLDALRLAMPGNKEKQKAAIEPILKKLLKEFNIKTIDDVNGEITTPNEVWSWARTCEKGRSGGRRYIYERAKARFGQQLEACTTQERAICFAREHLEWVRCHQPTNRPLNPDQIRKSKPKLQQKMVVGSRDRE